MVPEMIISAAAHRLALDELSAQLDAAGMSESAGIHGPNSPAWRMNAELVNFLGAGRAVLLQLAHPFVAYAIAEHSDTLRDARARFQRTFENIFKMCFGSRAEALQSAAHVHRIHARIHGVIGEDVGRYRRGDRYFANDAQALLWVHATLIDTSMHVQHLLGCAGAVETREQQYTDSKRFALLFGLRSEVPSDLSAFEHYMSDRLAGDGLAVSAPARQIAHFVLKAPSPGLEPAFQVYRAITASMLPWRLARAFDLPTGRRDRAQARMAIAGVAALRRTLPEALSRMPEAMAAETRLGLRAPSRLSSLLEAGMQSSLRLWSPRPARS